ncbi:MAG: GNAT family N-acetyltransferase [Chloroflexi bacterium]|nr:GNAT family N-acetyltransferase [Chloroflexota bacterium]
MRTPTIRPMLPSDVLAATRALVDDNWGDRHGWFEFATSHAACRAFVAEAEGDIVGTAVGTANGPAGWIGTIWVDPDHRRAGLGRALTGAVIDALDTAGCRTLVLVATEQGLPLYEGMGFVQQARYEILEAAGLDDTAPADDDVRPFAPADLPSMLALDREATGEDRAHAIRRFAAPDSTRVLRVAGMVRAFVIRAPWGGGATIAPEHASARRILDARRRASGPHGRVRVGIVTMTGSDGRVRDTDRKRIAALGLRPVWSAPRLVRGEPLAWRPDWIWGQFNHAMG